MPASWIFDPNSAYGAQGGSQVTTPIVSGPNGFLANNEDAAFYRHIAPFAAGNDEYSNFVRSKMTEVLRNFRSAQASNPNIQLPGFLQQYAPEQAFRQSYMETAPWQRGGSPASQFGGGRLKWYEGSR